LIKRIKNKIKITIREITPGSFQFSYSRLAFLIIFTFIILTGCGSNSDSPPKIVLGQDPCDNCFMIINEYKYAASLWLENGQSKRFDDIGCMIDFLNKNKNKVKAYWVNDFQTKEPLHAENAFFVDSDSIITPMGFGIVAFKSKAEAEKFAEKNKAEVASFSKLSQKFRTKN
jgi:copper chaperone NosL